MNLNKYSLIPFLDVLLNMCLYFVAIFIISFIQIKKEEIEVIKNTESKAEFIITVSWPTNLNIDVDTYLKDPLDNTCFYRNTNVGLLNLERDDRGHLEDYLNYGDEKKYIYDENIEIVTIRGIIPGEYILGIHEYSDNSIPHDEFTVNVKVEKINPSIKTVFKGKFKLIEIGHEVTVCRFTLDKEGNVSNINDLEYDFVQ